MSDPHQMEPVSSGREVRAGGRNEEVLRFDQHLRLIAVVFYAIGVTLLLVVANTGAYNDPEEINRAATNYVAAAGLLAAVLTLFFPWDRFDRQFFFAAQSAAIVLITISVYYSGGWDSFAYDLYMLAAVFCAVYYKPFLATLGVVLNVVAGATPAIYQPDTAELYEYLLVKAPIIVALATVSGYMVRQVVLRDRVLRLSEAERLSAQREAELDGLTRVSNRSYLEKFIDQGAPPSEFTLLFVDIDDFKQVNDAYGHAVGDEALKIVASSLRSCARKTDVVARYGGEEFAVLMFGTTTDSAWTLFERARERIAAASEARLGFPVRMSAGAANSGDFPGVGELLEAVDRAMYEAKREGKDRIRLAGTSGEIPEGRTA